MYDFYEPPELFTCFSTAINRLFDKAQSSIFRVTAHSRFFG